MRSTRGYDILCVYYLFYSYPDFFIINLIKLLIICLLIANLYINQFSYSSIISSSRFSSSNSISSNYSYSISSFKLSFSNSISSYLSSIF